jgi:hypothetical protein
MIVAIDLFGEATLREPDNCNELKAVAQAPAAPHADELDLSQVATRWDATHIWVRLDWLRATSGADASPELTRRFDKMIDYARGKGWVDGAPEAVRAHWEWGAY